MERAPTQGAAFTRAQMRALDRLAIEEYGIAGIVLMEHAGRSVAQALLDHESSRLASASGTCAIFCGGGNNGGDGFVIARWLDDARVRVACCCTAREQDTRGDALLARIACARAGVTLLDASSSAALDLLRARFAADPPRVVVDALLGTGFEGALRPEMARTIDFVDALRTHGGARTWAVDLPSGLDADTGLPAEPTVRADVTATFVGAKVGFSRPEAEPFVGRVEVLSIGVPRAAVERVRSERP